MRLKTGKDKELGLSLGKSNDSNNEGFKVRLQKPAKIKSYLDFVHFRIKKAGLIEH